MQSVLNYPSPRPWPPRELTIEELDGSVRVTFALKPAWHHMIATVVPALMGILTIVEVVVGGVALFTHRASFGMSAYATFDPETRRRIAWGGVAMLITGPGCLAVSLWELRKYRRWGRTPRTILGTGNGLTYIRLGAWGMRERFWAAEQIAGIKLRPTRGNLTPRLTLNSMSVYLRSGRRLRFSLPSPDPQLAGRIAARLATMLDCRLL